MKIKKYNLDTYLVAFLMFVTVLPTFLAQPLIFIVIFFLSLRIFLNKDFFLYFDQKILIFILFFPGLYLSLFFDFKEFLRYAIILFILFGFPFTSFRIKTLPIINVSIFILLYLISTQILLALENPMLLSFREFAYLNEWSHIFTTAPVLNIFAEVFSLTRSSRLGGLYYNPNVFAAVIVLYFFIFSISIENHEYEKKKINYFYLIVLFIVAISLLLTKSRTLILVFIFFIFFKYLNKKLFVNIIKKEAIFPLLVTFVIIFLNIQNIYSGIIDDTESFNIKFNIFYDYILDVDLFRFLFGGTFNIMFDTEFGMVFGAFGLSGTIAYFLLLKLIYKKFHKEGKLIALSFLIMGLGTTVFFSLLKISIIIPLIIVLFGSTYKTNLK
jgi:hypothetical protein